MLFTRGMFANPVTLQVGNYNFQLAGGGGGAKATLNGVPVEIFCDDFANEINSPSNNSANVTQLGVGADLSDTRFGGVSNTGWKAINLSSGADEATDEAFFNTGDGSGAAARYAMAAYLASLYSLPDGANTSNNKIQEAIWTLMDPKSEGAVIDPSGVDATSKLELAASWYMGISANQSALNAFLSGFEVVSDVNMSFPDGGGAGTRGFQEQIVMSPTPEPREGALALFGLFCVGGFLMKRARAKSALTAA